MSLPPELIVGGLHAVFIFVVLYAATIARHRRIYAVTLAAVGIVHFILLVRALAIPSPGEPFSTDIELYGGIWLVTASAVIGVLWSIRRRLRAGPEAPEVDLARREDFSEMSSEWLWETDVDMRFTYVSEHFYELSGVRPGAHLGKSRYELSGDAKNEGVWRLHQEDLKNRRIFRNFEYSAMSKSGKIFQFRISGKPIFDDAGVFKGYRGVGSEITDISSAITALKESEERFRHAFENAPVGMALITPEGNRFKVNKALAEFFGYSLEELSNTEMTSTNADPAQLAESMRLRQQVIDGEIETYKNLRTYRHKDGSIIHGEVYGALYRNERGDPEYFVAHTVDVTDRVKVEAALAESEARLRAFFDNAPMSLNVKGVDGRFIATNRFYEAWVGKPADKIIGRSSMELFESPKEYADYTKADEIVLETNAAYEFEAHTIKPDGGSFDRKITKFPIRSPDGAITGIGTFASDITEIRQKSALLQTLLDAAPFTISFRDSAGRFAFVNSRMTDVWGGKPEDYIGKSSQEAFGGDESRPIGDLVSEVVQTERPILEREITSLDAPGQVFLYSVIPVFRDNEEFYGVVVVGQNITELRTAEAGLRESENQFRALIDSSPSAILIKDRQGRYIQANQLWHDWFNPDGFDITEKTVFDLFPEDHAREVHRKDTVVVENERLIQTEMETPLANSRILTTLLQKFPIRGTDGEVIAIGGINTDISDLKKTEEALQESERQLRTITDSLPVLITHCDAQMRYRNGHERRRPGASL